MIEIRQVRVVYGRTIALDGLDLVLRPGVTGLFGPNGAGKSTLLRVLAGLLVPSRGDVTLDGRHLTARDESMRRRIGYAGHETGLYRHLTVEENLSLYARMYGVATARIDEVIRGVALWDRRRDRVGSLSAGLQRRAAVARALLHDPQILLLDEPYANLDTDASEAVSESVKSWRGEDRYAVIATHGAKRVKPFADASVILQHGDVVSYQIRTGDAEG